MGEGRQLSYCSEATGTTPPIFPFLMRRRHLPAACGHGNWHDNHFSEYLCPFSRGIMYTTPFSTGSSRYSAMRLGETTSLGEGHSTS